MTYKLFFYKKMVYKKVLLENQEGYTPNHEEIFLIKSKKNATFLEFGAKIGKNGQN